MNSIVNGLPLGLRFYDSEDQRCKYKYTCRKGVHHREYQYSDMCHVPPFQIVRTPIPEDIFDMYLHCSEDDTEICHINDVCASIVNAIELKTIGWNDYISYFGLEDCSGCSIPITTKTLVYIRLEDTINEWYSEDFWVDPTGVDTGDTNYRLWIAGGIRKTPDLRIWR